MKVARAKLSEIGPDDVDMEEYKVRDQRAASDPSQCPSCPNWGVGRAAWSCVANTVATEASWQQLSAGGAEGEGVHWTSEPGGVAAVG